MHYETGARPGILRHDPFKAIVVPRPIGWIGTVSPEGVNNLAPYSFFNALSDAPPVVVFSSSGHKDSLRNVEATGEFTCSIATYALREQMSLSSATVPESVDEFAMTGLTAAPSKYVRAPRVAQSPVALECRLWKMLPMPVPPGRTEPVWTAVFGLVVGVYIDDAVLRDGMLDIAAIQPIARMGYMDYSVTRADTLFTLNRPEVGPDGKVKQPSPEKWDGVYR
jgi:flavin reductase (DIM6/NTAB) family NADH-FMN oxidoreductase RutF